MTRGVSLKANNPLIGQGICCFCGAQWFLFKFRNPAIELHLDSLESSPHLRNLFLETLLIAYIPLGTDQTSGLFPSVMPANTWSVFNLYPISITMPSPSHLL